MVLSGCEPNSVAVVIKTTQNETHIFNSLLQFCKMPTRCPLCFTTFATKGGMHRHLSLNPSCNRAAGQTRSSIPKTINIDKTNKPMSQAQHLTNATTGRTVNNKTPTSTYEKTTTEHSMTAPSEMFEFDNTDCFNMFHF